jgi:hypothetical protein
LKVSLAHAEKRLEGIMKPAPGHSRAPAPACPMSLRPYQADAALKSSARSL